MSNQSLTERVETLEAKVSAIEASHRHLGPLSEAVKELTEVFYKCGYRFRREGDNKTEQYLLSQTGETEFNLIGLDRANRFSDPLILKGSKYHCDKIPKSVFDKHFGKHDAWILVPR